MLTTMKKINLVILVHLSLFFALSCGSKKNVEVTVESGNYIELAAPSAFLDSWSKENEVVIHELNEPDNLHPCNGTSQVRSEIFLYLHGSLLRTDLRTGSVLPGICKSMPQISESQLDLIFDLREDIKWDDNTLISPDDVIFTIKAAKNPGTNNAAFKPYFDLVEKAERVPNSTTKVLIRMKKVYVQNVALWADYPIIQKSFYDPKNVLDQFSFEQFNDTNFQADQFKDLNEWSTNFNSPPYGFDAKFISGLGPYRLKEWQQGQLLIFEKKDHHWTEKSKVYAEKSYPKKLIFKVNKDVVSTQLAFLKQEFDASTSLSSRGLIEMKDDSIFNQNYHGRFVDVYGYTFIALNTKPALSNNALALSELEVRKALALLTPVQPMIDVVCKGVNKPVVGPVAKMKPSYNSDLPLILLDVKKANEILDGAKWNERDQDGVRMKMLDGKKIRLELELAFLSTTPEWREMALMIEASMKQAGVKVNLNMTDLQTWLDKGTSHHFDMIMGSWNSSALPEDYAQLWATSSWKENGLNFSGFGNEKTDAIIDSLAVTMDETARLGMEKRIQAAIYNEYPYVFLYGLVRRTAIHKRFSGAELYGERPGVLYNMFQLNSIGVKTSVTP